MASKRGAKVLSNPKAPKPIDKEAIVCENNEILPMGWQLRLFFLSKHKLGGVR